MNNHVIICAKKVEIQVSQEKFARKNHKKLHVKKKNQNASFEKHWKVFLLFQMIFK